MTSKSQVIYHDLLNRIIRGDLSGKTTLPTEEVLTKHYDCSRPTLRKAMEELKQEGLVNTVRGSGVYITTSASDIGQAADRGNIFAIMFPNLGPRYFSDPVCNQLARHTADRGDSLIWGGYISPKSELLKLEIQRICEQYIAQRIAGLFFLPFEYNEKGDMINREILAMISSAGIPIVLIDSDIHAYPASNQFDLVSMDHIQASYILTEHIIEQGFRRIFFFAPPYSHHTIKLRVMGYQSAMLERRLTPEDLVEGAVEDVAALARFLDEKKPEAIICSNDITAIGFIAAVEAMGYKVPGDIAVAGFDHLVKAMPFVRPITSIEQPVDAIAQTALSLMFSRMEDPQKPVSRVIFPGKLIPEGTTAV
jgi:DNA-binding LacI/PurR family transcriptional regulator